jgi:formylglycine-generating enzyme required for sulfatase activity
MRKAIDRKRLEEKMNKYLTMGLLISIFAITVNIFAAVDNGTISTDIKKTSTLYGRLWDGQTDNPLGGGYVIAVDPKTKEVLGHSKTLKEIGPDLGSWQISKLPESGKVLLVGFHPSVKMVMAYKEVELKGGYEEVVGLSTEAISPKIISKEELGRSPYGVLALLGVVAHEANRISGEKKESEFVESLMKFIEEQKQKKENKGSGISKNGGVPIYTKWPFGEKEAKRRQIELVRKLDIPRELVLDLGNDVKIEFVLIPAGLFVMGSPANEDKRLKDETQHKVTITKAFYLQTTEVTKKQWNAVMGNQTHGDLSKEDDLPMASVSWKQAQEFLTKLNKKGHKGEYRLPTEAEWEYACRAGSEMAYYWGEVSNDDFLWHRENSEHKSHPVGSKKPNAWGLFDMSGNVHEWCSDWYADYSKRKVKDPKGPEKGESRVMRGSSWDNDSWRCRSACRARYEPNQTSYDIGFRVLLVVEQ